MTISPRLKQASGVITLFALTILTLAWRRPDQLHNPYIWVEEGVITLPEYAKHGWWSIFSPVAGYLVLPSKAIFLVAATLSFSHLVSIEYWLTALFTFGVCASIAYSPTYLKLPYLCAIATLAIPTNAEVFAVSEFAFWWGTLLAIVALFWASDKRLIWRCFLTAIGGLSSPLIIPLSGLFAIKALWLRRKSDIIALCVAIVTSLIQYTFLVKTGVIGKPSVLSLDVEAIVTKFFGLYASNWQPFTFGALCIVLLSITLFQKLDMPLLILIGCLGAGILASITRAPITDIHPSLAGPRYFFFPYIFLSWALIYVLTKGRQIWQRLTAAGLLLLSLHQFAQWGQRRHERISWHQQIINCENSDKYAIPVLTDGSANTWSVEMSGADCRRLSAQSLFH